MEIANNIRELRKAAGLTQRELAQKINKSFSAVQKYELGIAQPPIDVIRDIAKALNVDPFSIMDFDTATKALDDSINVHGSNKQALLDNFGKLNLEGQKKAVDYVEDLTKVDDYRK